MQIHINISSNRSVRINRNVHRYTVICVCFLLPHRNVHSRTMKCVCILVLPGRASTHARTWLGGSLGKKTFEGRGEGGIGMGASTCSGLFRGKDRGGRGGGGGATAPKKKKNFFFFFGGAVPPPPLPPIFFFFFWCPPPPSRGGPRTSDVSISRTLNGNAETVYTLYTYTYCVL